MSGRTDWPNPQKKVLLAKRVDSEKEVEIEPETSATCTTPSLGHLRQSKLQNSKRIFQEVPSQLSPSPGKTILVENVIRSRIDDRFDTVYLNS